jgi:hypothetical protein
LWCAWNHLHKDCPEKENDSSTPACCNWQLAEGRKRTPPTTVVAGVHRKRCGRRRHRS